MSTATTKLETRPAGTKALIYAVVSLATAVALWVVTLVFLVLGDRLVNLGMFGSFGVLGVLTAGLSFPIALVLGIVKRLAGGLVEVVDLRRIVYLAAGIPASIAVFGWFVELVGTLIWR